MRGVTEETVAKNTELLESLSVIGAANFDARSRGAELVFTRVDELLARSDFIGLHNLLRIAVEHNLALHCCVCLLMATNHCREACKPWRDNLTDYMHALLGAQGKVSADFLKGFDR